MLLIEIISLIIFLNKNSQCFDFEIVNQILIAMEQIFCWLKNTDFNGIQTVAGTFPELFFVRVQYCSSVLISASKQYCIMDICDSERQFCLKIIFFLGMAGPANPSMELLKHSIR